MKSLTFAVVTTLTALGCSSTSEPGSGKPAVEGKGPLNPAYDAEHTVHFETQPVAVAPGSEAMSCEYRTPLDRDIVVAGFGTKQAEGGHHMVLFRSLVPKEPGTVVDCTSAESMATMMLALTQMSVQEPGASSIEFPEGMVVVLPKGTQLVTQSHYINSSDRPLEIHDTLDIWLTDRDLSGLTQLHLFVNTLTNFEIPAAAEAYTAKAGCTLEHDIDVLALSAHMHESGKQVSIDVGNAGAMRRIAEVTDWKPEMRDIPPIMNFMQGDAPSGQGHFAQGESVELSCTWNNPETHSITFPNEMCAFTGYYVSETPGAADIMCLTPL